jgi:hypothetical protein
MRGNLIITAAVAVFLVSFIGILSHYPNSESSAGSVTGAATTTTASSVTIQSYVAIAASANLSAGIDFGTIATVPALGLNATYNYNGTSNKTWTNETLYWISVSEDSNKAVDFCVLGEALNTSGGDEIGLNNYTWSDSTSNNLTLPVQWGDTSMTTSYAAGSTNVGVGSNNYYRFFLNITAGQAAGTYNNTVTFQGVPNGDSCS